MNAINYWEICVIFSHPKIKDQIKIYHTLRQMVQLEEYQQRLYVLTGDADAPLIKFYQIIEKYIDAQMSTVTSHGSPTKIIYLSVNYQYIYQILLALKNNKKYKKKYNRKYNIGSLLGFKYSHSIFITIGDDYLQLLSYAQQSNVIIEKSVIVNMKLPSFTNILSSTELVVPFREWLENDFEPILWRPLYHQYYPVQIKHQIKTCLMMTLLKDDKPLHLEAMWWKIPREIQFKIFQYIAS